MHFAGRVFLLMLLSVELHSQPGNLFIQNFPPEAYNNSTYGSSPQNLSITQDRRGIVYVANSSALIEFDGSAWQSVRNAEALNQDCEEVTANSNGVIFLGGENDFGYIAGDSLGFEKFYSLSPLWQNRDQSFSIKRTDIVNDTVFFIATDFILRYIDSTIMKFDMPGNFLRAWIFKNKLYLTLENGIFNFSGGKFTKSTEFNLPPASTIINVFETADNTNLIVTEKNGVFTYEKNHASPIKWTLGNFQTLQINDALKLSNGTIALGTASSGILLIDSSGEIIKHIDKSTGLYDNQVNGLYADAHHGLWIALSRGISRIEYPGTLTFFNEANELDGIVTSVLRQGDTVYAGTTTGFYYCELNDKNFRFNKLGSFTNVFDIASMSDGIWFASKEGLFRIHQGKLTQLFPERTRCITESSLYPNYAFLGVHDGIEVVHRNGSSWKFLGRIKGITSEIRTIQVANDGTLWAGYVDLFKVNFTDSVSLNPLVTPIDNKHGWNKDLGYIEVAKASGKIYFGTWKGVYSFNPKSNKIEADSSLGKYFWNAPYQASLITEDKKGTVWIHSENHTGLLEDSAGSRLWNTRPLAQMPATGAWSIYVDANNNLWIGTEEGLFLYSAKERLSHTDSFSVLIRSIVLHGDEQLSTSQSNKIIEIPHSKADLLFKFSAMSYNAREVTQYSYWLQGSKSNWSKWSESTLKEFSNLNQGTYVFHVKAKNIYGIESKATTFKFIVLPPWYRTWWAYLIYAAFAFLLIRLIIQLNQHRLINEKKRLVKKVAQRTEMISKQKQIIEAEKDKVEKKSAELEETLTTLKRTQNQLLLSEKLASVGQLTAGVAHEINNPINFVTGNINPLKKNFHALKKLLDIIDDLKPDDDLRKKINEIESLKKEIDFDYTLEESEKLLNGIEEGSRRTASIVKGLRQFSRMDEDVKKRANINEGIESTLILIQNKLKFQNIELELSLGKVPDILCYPGQLNQVFMNLFTNAIDAIGSNGKIFITTAADNQFVKISVRDTGPGMSEEVKKKIFDPFFTTKEVGKGTGLGLSISYGIIEKHQGNIEVKSELGKGTEFIITLPI